jgi:hypothetical protein
MQGRAEDGEDAVLPDLVGNRKAKFEKRRVRQDAAMVPRSLRFVPQNARHSGRDDSFDDACIIRGTAVGMTVFVVVRVARRWGRDDETQEEGLPQR